MNTSKQFYSEQARRNDLTAIQQLLNNCQLPQKDITTDLLEHFFVARKNNSIAGLIGLEKYGNYGLLRSLAVGEPYRGSGLGKQLVDHLEKYAVGIDIEELFLLTTTADSFFSRLGYV